MVPNLECWLLVWMVGGLGLGIWGIVWARGGSQERLVFWGRSLFIAALLFLGASSLIAAFHRADGLVPLGLTAGLLVVGMLWDNPASMRPETFTLPEEI